MAYEPGGVAEKLGNRYEGLWAANQLLLLLQEKLTSVTVEEIGPPSKGVDLSVVCLDGKREAQQCKGSMAQYSEWTMGALNQKGILKAAKEQIQSNTYDRFLLISSVQASTLEGLIWSAQNSPNNVERWFRHQILEGSEKGKKEFFSYCKYLKLDTSSVSDLNIARNILSSMSFYHFVDNSHRRDELMAFAEVILDGNPLSALAALKEIAEENLHHELTPYTASQLILKKGFACRSLEKDSRISPKIKDLNNLFSERMAGQLAGNQLIHRKETDKILELIDDETDSNLVILHGAAGSGKSGILFELSKMLESNGTPYLAISLDLFPPTPILQEYGKTLGLPDDPILCFLSQIADCPAVLILDQIDSLRWTSTHSSDSWGAFQRLVNRAIKSGLRVVGSCRSFDLENDPQIRKWKKKQKVAPVEVEALPDSVVKEFVEAFGCNYSDLDIKQRSLLRIIHNLTMWSEIVASSPDIPTFWTVSDLVQQFWQSRYRTLEQSGLSQEKVNELLELIIGEMDKHSRPFAPARLLDDHARLSHELQSLNILRVNSNKVIFCHQTYLDYLIARKLIREIDMNEMTVAGWLGSKERQSLFRREQIRQLLVLIRDEDRLRYHQTLEDLCWGESIRFHIKQLILQYLGSVDEISAEESALVIDLLEQEKWREHVIDQVVWDSAPWFTLLAGKNIWTKWISSGNPTLIELTLKVAYSVSKVCGDLVASLLQNLMLLSEKGKEQASRVFRFDPSDESDALFEIRLELTRDGFLGDLVHWPTLAKKHPERCMRLIEATIQHSIQQLMAQVEQEPGSRLGSKLDAAWRHDTRVFIDAANQAPGLVWKLLIPLVQEAIEYNQQIDHEMEQDFILEDPTTWSISKRIRLPKIIFEILASTGRSLAASQPELIKQEAIKLAKDGFFQWDSVLLRTLAGLPDSEADWVIEWIIMHPKCLSGGSADNEPPEKLAADLIACFAPHCSTEAFERLEETLLNYHSDYEINSFYQRRDLGKGRDQRPNMYGKSQLFLLNALPENRRRGYVTKLLQVLERKFENTKFSYQEHPTGGRIVSSIPRENLKLIRDEAWLSIIRRYSGAGTNWEWIELEGDFVGEASAENFASDIRELAKQEPSRFAQLGNKIPPNTDPCYIRAILQAMATSTPPDSVIGKAKQLWEPASAEDIESLLFRQEVRSSSSFIDDLAHIVRSRAEADWSSEIRDILVHVVLSSVSDQDAINAAEAIVPSDYVPTDSPSESLELSVYSDPCSNSTMAIAALLFKHPDWFTDLETPLVVLAGTPVAVWRIACIESCLPVLNIDRDRAVQLFLKAIDIDNDLILGTRMTMRFLNYATPTHLQELAPVITRMINSSSEHVSGLGAQQATVQYIVRSEMGDQVQGCLQGSTIMRKGVATVAADLIKDDLYDFELCCNLLRHLFHDEDNEVREAAADAFRKSDPFESDHMVDFAIEFTNTPAFQDEPYWIMHALESYPGSLLSMADLVFSALKVFSGPLSEATRNERNTISQSASDIAPILLRLYEQAEHSGDFDIVQRCLNIWDTLLERRVAGAGSLLNALDGQN